MARQRKRSTSEEKSSQLTELPGETFEDIFLPEENVGPTAADFAPRTPDGYWKGHLLTGSDWDAILGRQPRTEEDMKQ